jgi:hypothetical protein
MAHWDSSFGSISIQSIVPLSAGLSNFPLPGYLSRLKKRDQRQWKNNFSLRPLRLKRSPARAGQAGGEHGFFCQQ